jgi:sec-independent protein translocase protein TatA
MDFSLIQIAIVLVIALLVFGPKRLPELGRSLGSGMREFRQTVSGLGDDLTREDEPATRAEPASKPEAGSSSTPAEDEAVAQPKA